MRVAQIAPLYESVPPKCYGGTERVVYALTEELVTRGYDVTLFATADSQTSARLISMADRPVRLGEVRDPLALHLAMLEQVLAHADRFDIIHSHIDFLGFPFARMTKTPVISTLHGRLDLPEHRRVLGRFRDMLLVSISDSQRDPVRDLGLCWWATVRNGIRIQHFPSRVTSEPEPYLVFLGRIAPEKGPDRAVEIALRAGMKLKIAAKIDAVDRRWAEDNFLPSLLNPGIEYIGEVNEETKAALLCGARALLFPIDWPEPFGLVMVESMACGTPVIALDHGSVSEILIDGKTGFICQSVDEMIAAVQRIDTISRRACRHHAISCFSAQVMADGYETVYERLVQEPKAALIPFGRSYPVLKDGRCTEHSPDLDVAGGLR